MPSVPDDPFLNREDYVPAKDNPLEMSEEARTWFGLGLAQRTTLHWLATHGGARERESDAWTLRSLVSDGLAFEMRGRYWPTERGIRVWGVKP